MRQRRRKRKDAVDRLYDSFAVKDLTREEFRREYLELTNPVELNRDLRRMIMDRRAIQTVNILAGEQKEKIDSAVRRQV